MSGSKRPIDGPAPSRLGSNKKPRSQHDRSQNVFERLSGTGTKQPTETNTNTNPNTSAKKQGTENNDTNVLSSIEIHPLLRKTSPSVVVPKSYNPLKNHKVRDGFVVNPYINQQDFSIAPDRPRRELKMNPQGKFIERAKELRAKREAERKELEEREKLQIQGLTPIETLGEQNYIPEEPPSIEWWDKPFVKGRDYSNIDKEDGIMYGVGNTDEDSNPITIYIQHPVPIMPAGEKHKHVPEQPLYLTKKEMKKLRRNERAIKLKEKQDRIKLGLDPTPAPKIKLKNLMNVLTNDAIKNPTEVEMKVRKEIEERRLKHERDNLERMANAEDKSEKIHRKIENDLDKGYHSAVFKIDRLMNPQHCYKVDINAKQLGLFGMCLNLKDGFTLIVVEGGEKFIGKYKKLLMDRINWTENIASKKKKLLTQGEEENGEVDNETEDIEDLSTNKCQLLWEGQLSSLHFSKWSVYDFNNNEEVMALLSRYKLENYWIQASNQT
ncbi:hypothetical protein CANARDRAFT_28942 [[Candida] arabinofermentans NRRL YB-2248]|uniref:Pre-mRNA-splicing factor 3 domain-containing protein n=1 Tax=[Candida] arabinofermentans NRRL YB-2248 TaxID=983967 RepID=A0A1E4SZ95_9ASCO|nr:hypothetical protein CANARDRAFT_28942 [[Candida] arabinofermentans NRRL YB-2248]